jgi:hypothetical protein
MTLATAGALLVTPVAAQAKDQKKLAPGSSQNVSISPLTLRGDYAKAAVACIGKILPDLIVTENSTYTSVWSPKVEVETGVINTGRYYNVTLTNVGPDGRQVATFKHNSPLYTKVETPNLDLIDDTAKSLTELALKCAQDAEPGIPSIGSQTAAAANHKL